MGQEYKDYYKTLGIEKTASQEKIKKAYRKLAKEWHPDRHVNDNDKDKAREKFKEINEANQILGDPEKRKQYDTFGQYVGSHGMPGGGINFEDLFKGGGGSPFEDLFDIFGGGFSRQSQQGPRRGEDLHYSLRIKFNDSIRGIATKINLNVDDTCDTCHGSGSKPGTSPVTCKMCGGRGVIAQSQGFFSISRTCPQCTGRGTVIESPCSTCRGIGVVRKNKQVTVKVPAGVENGTTLRFKGKGQAAPSAGIPGDLYLTVDIEKHPVFQRDGSSIHMNLPITITEAALGAKIDVPTLNGKVKLKVPAGTVSGKVFRLRGRGAPGRFGNGDMFVKTFIVPPSKVSKQEKELLKKLEDASKGNPRDAIFDIVGKVK